jgi:hypothetical protein
MVQHELLTSGPVLRSVLQQVSIKGPIPTSLRPLCEHAQRPSNGKADTVSHQAHKKSNHTEDRRKALMVATWLR